MDIVSDFVFVCVLQAQSLLIELAYAVNTLRNVIIVNEGLRCLVSCELEEEDGVTLVGDGGLCGGVDRLLADTCLIVITCWLLLLRLLHFLCPLLL